MEDTSRGTIENSGSAWATKPALGQAVLKKPKTTRNRDIVVHVVTPALERKRQKDYELKGMSSRAA